MRKILSFLVIFVLCAGCENYKADIDDYLSYWSTQAAIVRSGFDPAITVQTDTDTIQSIPSSSDVTVTFTVRNPKNFTFQLPGDAGAPTDIIVFPTDVAGTMTGSPKQPDDYELTQDSYSQLTLTYKKEFLQKHEYGKKNIGPTITLYAKDGRKFSETFKLNVKANTPPPNLTYRAIGKTATPDGNGKQYYVLFLEAKGMDTEINSSELLHKDIAQLSIAEGSDSYTSIPLTVKTDKSGFDISSAGGRLLGYSDAIALLSTEVKEGVTPDPLPASTEKWIIRIKTDVPVGGAVKQYRLRLQDEAGLLSEDELRASTSTNKVSPVTITVTSGSWTVTPKHGTNADPHEITYGPGVQNILLKAETATSGATVHYKLERNGLTVSESSGTTPVTIELPAVPDAVYKLTAWAVKEGFENSPEEVVCYKTKRNNTLEISAGSNAWGQLKAAVAVAEDGDIFLVNGTIKATSADGNSGAIEVTKSITIKGKHNNANTDILDANSHLPDSNAPLVKHRIFTVKNGGNLTLENLTLTKGLASGSGAAQDGGAIYNEGTLSMYGGILDFNKAEHWGGGIFTLPGARVTLGTEDNSRPCTIKNNTGAHEGGGIYNQGTLAMYGGSIEVNTGVNGGGGLYIYQGVCTLNSVDIHNNLVNSGKKGSGIFLYRPPANNASLMLTHNTKIGSSSDQNTLCLGARSSSQSAFVTAKDLDAAAHINIEPHNYGAQKNTTLVKVPNDASAAAYKEYFHLTENGSMAEGWLLIPDDGDKELVLQKGKVVAGGGSGAWNRLKTAIQTAEAGDTIVIDGTIQATSPGNFGEIPVIKSITIRGKNGNRDTDVLDANKGVLGSNAHRIFKVTGAHTKLTLENITLKNGKAAGVGDLGTGGGIYCKSIKEFTVKGCAIADCGADIEGGGICVAASGGVNTKAVITGTSISGNTAGLRGGGIAFNPSNGTPYITGVLDSVTVENNSLTSTDSDPYFNNGGAGIYFGGGYNDSSKYTVKGGTIAGNNAGDYSGGGAYIKTNTSGSVNGTLTLKAGVHISGNTAQNGGGVAVHSAKLIIEPGCTIGGDNPSKGNKTITRGKGGGIYVGEKAECTIKEGVTIRHNTANATGSTLNGGGGIYVGGPGSADEANMGRLTVTGTIDKLVVISDCIVNGNYGSGGGIYSKGKVTLEYAKLEHNTAPHNGQGGGIYINQDAGDCILNNTEITGCEAASAGGGVCISNNRAITLKGSTKITPSSGTDENKKGKNDVFLTPYSYIHIDGILDAPTLPLARISIADGNYLSYTNSTHPVLKGSVTDGSPKNYKKFTVTPGGSPSQNWYVGSNGALTTTQP